MTEYKYCTDSNVKCEESKCENIKLCNKKNEISSGAFGKVYLCDKNDKVLKTVEESNYIHGEIDYVKYNNEKLKDGEKYKHVAEIFLPVTDKEQKLDCANIKYIVMERVMTLDKYIELMNKQITDIKKLFDAKFLLIRKLIEALRFLHFRIGYCHNDLKPQNIGIKKINNNGKSFWIIKFIDMGASIQIKQENRDKMYYFEQTDRLFQQTLLFSCPLLLENIQHDYYRDMWAMGCIMYYIVCGKYMITGNNEPQIYRGLMNMDFDSLSYMLCIDHENPDLKKKNTPMKQCFNTAMGESRKAFNETINSWYEKQEISIQQISFITTTIFDFMYKSVPQSYEITDMYKNIQDNRKKGGASANSASSYDKLKQIIFEKSETKSEMKSLLERKKPDQNYFDNLPEIIKEHRKSNYDKRDVDMLRNLAYLKMNPAYIKKLIKPNE